MGMPLGVQITKSHDSLTGILLKVQDYKVTYNGADGKPKTTTVKYLNMPHLLPFIAALNQFSTSENPNITPEEAFQLECLVDNSTADSTYVRRKDYTTPTPGNTLTVDSLAREDFLRQIKKYSNKFSDGGEEITVKEQALIMDLFLKRYNKDGLPWSDVKK